MDYGAADLLADRSLVGANRFNIPLTQHDVIRTPRQFKYAFLSPGYSMKKTEQQLPWGFQLC